MWLMGGNRNVSPTQDYGHVPFIYQIEKALIGLPREKKEEPQRKKNTLTKEQAPPRTMAGLEGKLLNAIRFRYLKRR